MTETTEKAEALRQRVREFMQTRVPAEYIDRTRNGLGHRARSNPKYSQNHFAATPYLIQLLLGAAAAQPHKKR